MAGDRIRVQCSPATQVLVTGGAPGLQYEAGEGLVDCVVELGHLVRADYVRVTVTDAAGRRAWTNPIWLAGNSGSRAGPVT